MVGDERLVVGLDVRELRPKPFGILEAEAPVGAVDVTSSRSRRSAQKSSGSLGGDAEDDRCTIPRPARPRRACGYSKNVRSLPALPFSSA